MTYNGLILNEHVELMQPVKEILMRFGINYVIDKSYIVVAAFDSKQYFAMADSVSDLLESASPHFTKKEFVGKVYKIKDGDAIPISCKNTFDIQNW